MGSFLFLWEEWHLEQRSQLCEHLCLRQADWQRPNTPSQINRPRRVGSHQDDSRVHTQEDSSMHAHTQQTVTHLCARLPQKRGQSLPGWSRPRWHAAFVGSGEGSPRWNAATLLLHRFFSLAIVQVKVLSVGLPLLSAAVCVCVGSLLFLLAMWAPGQTKHWLFSWAFLCEIPLFMPRWKDFVNISSSIQFQ